MMVTIVSVNKKDTHDPSDTRGHRHSLLTNTLYFSHYTVITLLNYFIKQFINL